ncbi:FadR family transcriptional regulator [Sphingomonas donggukensis]|uniref:FadR family transcriptional regulator n=1 Tax=Sphingomonas donggukensis TaxID=2949093 RepID=A0ABY4TQZ9_9SPHN|nr:FadR/GntR family transcriptional regulator [Sphingomonas donggukensis]URW74718.1 FadR family transcriptional regulator [Sphingomonas donggukensis]
MADRLFQSIADEIAALIDAGTFPPGSRLPGERELAERFEVSRVTIREAEIALQAVGRIRIKTGAGVFVSETQPGAAQQLPAVSAFELTEARSLFEAEAAALAAPIITDATLADLDALLQVMADEAGDTDRSTEADRDFHRIIAAASGNQAIIFVIEQMWRLRTEVPQVRAAHAAICKSDVRARQQEHQSIVDALRAHDPKAARVAMRQHFRRLLETLLDDTEQREITELRRRTAESRERFLMSAHLG